MHVEAVGEMATVAVAHVYVGLGERGLRLYMVEVFHRHLFAFGHRQHAGLEPPRHHTAEVEQQGAVGLHCFGYGCQLIDDTVALELLSRHRYPLCLIDRSGPPIGPHARIVAFAAEVHRLPVAGVAVAAGRGLPGAVGTGQIVYKSYFLNVDSL